MSLLKSIFNSIKNARQVQLDLYILSRNPQSTGDVERLIREYDKKTQMGIFHY